MMISRINRAFTLIELLIVVAILAVLAAIAAPNFLEAQTRTRTSAVLSDMRAVKTALETYQVDHAAYPHIAGDGDNVMKMDGMMRMPFLPVSLTTPIAYLNQLPLDPFKPANMADHDHTFVYMGETNVPEPLLRQLRANVEQRDFNAVSAPRFALLSTGPDRKFGAMAMQMNPGPPPIYGVMYMPSSSVVQYDPTNGTLSAGDIVRFND
jgi:type II secretion system protein G